MLDIFIHESNINVVMQFMEMDLEKIVRYCADLCLVGDDWVRMMPMIRWVMLVVVEVVVIVLLYAAFTIS